MDSDDDTYGDCYYNDMDSEDDDAYDEDYLDSNVNRLQPKPQNYTILSEVDIRRRQEEDITTVSTILSISKVWSSILMRHYNWSISKVHEEWFADEEKVRKSVGLLDNPVLEIDKKVEELTCRICFDIYSIDKMAATVCGHLFCYSCWSSYITTSINDGPGCLMLRCPDPSCNVVVDQDLIDQFASHEDKEKFSRYFLRSYIESNRKTKWCPSPGCGSAIEFEVGSTGNYDVTCSCFYSFCWNCSEEVHRPVDCETVAKWILKHSSEAENMNYLLAYTKPCPKCKKPIEKNHGCMHMTCRVPCRFEFCWLCLDAWKDHKTCNRFADEEKKDGTDIRRKNAKKYLEKYTHYYERWASNQSSRKKAMKDLQEFQNTKLDKLMAQQTETSAQIEFIKEAWLQIVECRRVLKWTYAYGYYLPENELAKKQFFEYLQGEAEFGLERLHYCVEKELQVFIEAEDLIPGFDEFRVKLVGLTMVTRNYFENLVEALENGLSDVESHATCKKRRKRIKMKVAKAETSDDE